MIRATLGLLLIVCLFLIPVLIAAVLILNRLRKAGVLSREVFRQTVAQVIAGVVSGALVGIVSFGAAYRLYKVQEDEKVSDIRTDSFIKIKNEVGENRLTLEVDMKTDKLLVPLPLKTMAWEQGKYQTPIRTPQLLDGLKLLYDEIERYNWHVSYMRFMVTEKSLTRDKVPEEAWKSTKTVNDKLLAKLREFEKLTSREAVLLGQMSRQDYKHGFGPWEAQVNPLSAFQQAKNQPGSLAVTKSSTTAVENGTEK